MLDMFTEYYTLVLAVLCMVFLNRYINKQLILAFAFSFAFIYSLNIMQAQFGWWQQMGATYVMDLAAAMMMVCGLICFNRIVGIIAAIGLVAFASLLISNNTYTMMDVLTSLAAGLPSLILFTSVGEDKPKVEGEEEGKEDKSSTLDT